MLPRRAYDDGCALAHALNLVGERWALLIVRELLLGPKRFTDLRSGLPAISPNILTQRLRELGIAGIVRHSKLPPPASHQIYALTEHGHELEPVVVALGRWALRSPTQTIKARCSTDSEVLLLSLVFDPEAARGFRARLVLQLGEERFGMRIADQRIDLARNGFERPDATLDTTLPLLHAMLRGARELDELIASGDVRMRGERDVVARLPAMFKYPRPGSGP